MRTFRLLAWYFLTCLPMLVNDAVQAQELPTFKLVARHGRWFPEVLEVPANRRFRLEITNQDEGTVEFESKELRRELEFASGARRVIVFAPVKPGSYPFFDEYRPKTARGRIVVK